MEINIEEIFKKVIESERFEGYLAEEVSKGFAERYYKWDMEGNVIKDDFRKLLQEEVRNTIKDYFNNYYETNSIGSQVKDIINRLTKDEVIKLLREKLGL